MIHAITTKPAGTAMGRSRLTPGQMCFIIGEVVSVLGKDGELQEAVVVRFPVRWHGGGFRQAEVPIEAITLP